MRVTPTASSTERIEPHQTGDALVAAMLATAMASPSLLFLLKLGPAVNAMALAVFALPLAVLLPRAHFDETFARALFIVMLLVLAPFAVSVVIHFPSYDRLELAYVCVRLAASGLYIFTIACLSIHPRATRILRLALVYLSFIFVITWLFNASFFGKWHWDRFTTQTGHFNWWGEIFTAATLGAAFITNRFVRYVIWSAIFVSIFLVQSRTALACCLVIVLFAELENVSWYRLVVKMCVITCLIVPILVIVDILSENIDFLNPVVTFISQQVLLLDDHSRGIDTAASGRLDDWILGMQLVASRPLLGVGFSKAEFIAVEETGKLLHSGHFMLAGDLGLIGYFFVSCVVAFAVLRALRSGELTLAGYMIAFWFVFMPLSPRVVNMSVLPMLFWMFVSLMWMRMLMGERDSLTTGASASAKTGGRESRLGARWRSIKPSTRMR